jgi:hypothetical protein
MGIYILVSKCGRGYEFIITISCDDQILIINLLNGSQIYIYILEKTVPIDGDGNNIVKSRNNNKTNHKRDEHKTKQNKKVAIPKTQPQTPSQK